MQRITIGIVPDPAVEKMALELGENLYKTSLGRAYFGKAPHIGIHELDVYDENKARYLVEQLNRMVDFSRIVTRPLSIGATNSAQVILPFSDTPSIKLMGYDVLRYFHGHYNGSYHLGRASRDGNLATTDSMRWMPIGYLNSDELTANDLKDMGRELRPIREKYGKILCHPVRLGLF